MTHQEPVTWIPILGTFNTDPTELVFKGGTVMPPPAEGLATTDLETVSKPAFGLALSNQVLSDGDVVAEVVFEGKVGPDSACEIAISYDDNARHIVAAGLGGTLDLFAIREFGGPRTGVGQWWDHVRKGDRDNLQADITYRIEVKFRGALVTLLVNGVTVASSEVTSPMGRARQVGILCRSRNDVRVRSFTVNANKPTAFMIMQFGADDDVYKDVIKEICKDSSVKVVRADEMVGSDQIISDITREIGQAQLVIADVTATTNANVYFEVGYSLALKKPTILLAKKGTPLPFDVAGFRVLFYQDTIGGKNRLEDGLRRHLDAILGK